MEILALLFLLLFVAVSIGSFVCWILVLVKLFPDQGVLYGILGIICGLYTFIWGWMNASRLGIQQTMMIWTGCFIASIVLQVIATIFSAAVSG
ncbi:MAG: hypothetical protein AAFQ89_13135 [Cyanobacteria bacterium J06626_18]